jgi:cysteine-rich repeat protein
MGNDTNRGAAEENSQLLDEPRRTGRNPHVRGQLRHVPQNQPEFRSSRMLPRFTCALPFLVLSATGCIKPLGCVELLQCAVPGVSAEADAAESQTPRSDASPEVQKLGEGRIPADTSVTRAATSSHELEAGMGVRTDSSQSGTHDSQSGVSTSANGDADASRASDDGGTTFLDSTSTADPPECGDGTWEPPAEECDDGNTRSLDGCNRECKRESRSVSLTSRICEAPDPQRTCANDAAANAHYCYNETTAVRELAAKACSLCYGTCTEIVTEICGGNVMAFAILRASPECDDYFVYEGTGECSGRGGRFEMGPGAALNYCEAGGQWSYTRSFL